MSDPSEILIVGAGVLGLATAVELQRRGHAVRVVDPGGDNASRVAAGMIAPAMESALDGATPERAALLAAARDLWPAFAAATGVTVVDAHTEWRGVGAEALTADLVRLGFEAVRDGDRVRVAGELQIEADRALDAWAARLSSPPVARRAVGLSPDGGGWIARLDDGRWLEADAVVLATGAAAAVAGLPDRVARAVDAIQPIRGQIGRVAAEGEGTLRGAGAYWVRAGGAAHLGATMEPGRRDLDVDPVAGQSLLTAGARLMTAATAPIDWRVGVRGATADGLPLAGTSGEEGLFLALAPRRNGWLLAPLVAQTLADTIEGRDSGVWAGALDPRRAGVNGP